MRIVRYQRPDGRAGYGSLDADDICQLPGLDAAAEPGDVVASLSDVTLLAPCKPTKVVCAGRNYAAHIKERGQEWPQEPFLFLKGPNTVVGHGAEVIRPKGVERFDYEAELTLVFGKRAHRVPAAQWRDYVVGFTCGNDYSVRDWQKENVQWFRAKSSDTLCPLGPWIETDVPEPEQLRIRTLVNGDVRQDSNTSDLVFKLPQLVEFLTSTVTFEPGDVVLTGTPSGVGNVDPGDVVEVEIEGIGTLRNTIVEE